MTAEPTTWTTGLGDKVAVWEATPGDWRWHVTAGNGKVLEQGEGHTRREDAVRAAVRYHPEHLAAAAVAAYRAALDGGAEEAVRGALRVHHPIMRSETGPFSGCRCGQVKLGQDVIGHVTDHLRAALDPQAGDGAR